MLKALPLMGIGFRCGNRTDVLDEFFQIVRAQRNWWHPTLLHAGCGVLKFLSQERWRQALPRACKCRSCRRTADAISPMTIRASMRFEKRLSFGPRFRPPGGGRRFRLYQARLRMLQKPAMLLLLFPLGWSRRKPELSYQQHSQSAGPYRQLSSGQWALSEALSIELADTDWIYESALARCRRPRFLHGIRRSLENQKCSSPGRRLPRLGNLQLALSTLRLPLLVPPSLAQLRMSRKGRRCRCGGVLRWLSWRRRFVSSDCS